MAAVFNEAEYQELLATKNHWRNLPEVDSLFSTETEKAYSSSNPLFLSPSAVETYMKCPRQYQFKYELKVPPESQSTKALQPALAGRLMHQVWAVFNQQATPVTHTPEALLDIATRLLAFDEHRLNPLPANWLAQELAKDLKALTRLALQQVSQSVLEGLTAWCKAYPSYFSTPLVNVLSEFDLPTAPLPGLPNWVVWRGMRPDALLERENQQFELVDYKRYSHTRFTAKEETETKHLNSFLAGITADAVGLTDKHHEEEEPLLRLASSGEDWVLQHRTTFPVEALDKINVQLPLYALAIMQMLQAKGLPAKALGRVSLAIIRPVSNGVGPLWLPFEIGPLLSEMPTAKTPFTVWLAQHVLEPIAKQQHRVPTPHANVCGTCHYSSLCSAAEQRR